MAEESARARRAEQLARCTGSAAGSVVVAHLAVVHRGAGFGIGNGNVVLFHHGTDDPVVGALHPLAPLAVQPGLGVSRNVGLTVLILSYGSEKSEALVCTTIFR